MRLANDLLAVPIEAATTLSGNRLVTTLDNLPAAPVTSFELTVDGGPNGLFTVGNQLCAGATIDSTFTSHTGQTVSDSSPLNLVGSCVPVPLPAAAARPSLSVSVRRLTRAPLMTVRARSAKDGRSSAACGSPCRRDSWSTAQRWPRAWPSPAGSRRLGRRAWSLSRSGVLTVKAPKGGSSLVTATIQAGALRADGADQA